MKLINLSTKFTLIILFVSIIIQFELTAQQSEGGIPVSFGQKTRKIIKQEIPTLMLPVLNIRTLLKEDSINYTLNYSSPFRFAKGFKVNYSLNNSGSWDTTISGDKLWRLRIKSKGAYSLICKSSAKCLPVNI
jgi:lysyl endopeptidase